MVRRRMLSSTRKPEILWGNILDINSPLVGGPNLRCVQRLSGANCVAASNAVFLTVLNSSNAMNAVNFADHHFYVTKQKDTEAQATHPYNILDPTEPIIDFAKFFDGESLDQEDL